MLVESFAGPNKPRILHWPEMSEADRVRLHGSGTHSKIEALTVSERTSVEFEFRIGEQSVVTGGHLLIVWRWPFDWSDLQTDDPNADGFMRVEHVSESGSSKDVHLSADYKWIAGIEPWHHQIRVKVDAGLLHAGDRVIVSCGETADGLGSWQAPTCAAERCQFLMLIDHQGDHRRSRLVDNPPFQLLPGKPHQLVAIAESDVVAREPFDVTVRAEDCWGNPTTLSAAPEIAVAEGQHVPVQLTPAESKATRPIYRFTATPTEPGNTRLTTNCDGLEAISNPIRVHETRPEQQLLWGDVHSGQTEIGCGAGSLAEHYAFGRDCAAIQFMTHQANDHYVTLDDWNHTREVTDQFYEPGKYVPFLGCEWSPYTKDGGDRNVIYLEDDPVLRRSDRFFLEKEPDPEPDIPTAPDFHDAFRDRDVLVNIHVGGRMTNLEWYEQKIEKLCEAHSTHGTNEWFVFDALARGYRVGITAGTDGVMGRPAACNPGRRLIRNLRNGLTGVYARELTRESLWEAFQNRCMYGTTGERIRVWFEVDGHPMGSEFMTDSNPKAQFNVEGTKAIERVDLLRCTDVIHSWHVSPKVDAAESRLLRVLWGGTERRGTARLQKVDWDGSLSISGGEIELVETINFQSHDDHAEQAGSSRITWSSKTAGNAAGILVRVNSDASAELKFETEPHQLSATVSQVMTEELHADAGGVNRFVRIGTPPDSSGPDKLVESFVDTDKVTGVIPYWIRVTQVDQSIAWSSPVYVTRR